MAHHLKKHPVTGNFYFRMAVPKSLQGLLGFTEYHHNLHTKDCAQARYVGYILSARTLIYFQELKQMVKGTEPTVADILQSHAEGKLKKYEGNFNPATGQISVKADPKDPEDVEAAYQWQQRTIKDNPQFFQPKPAAVDPAVVSQIEEEHRRLLNTLDKGVKRVKLRKALEEFKGQKRGKKAFLDHVFPSLEKFVDWMEGRYAKVTVNQVTRDDMKAYLIEIKLKNPKKVFHSFRHTLIQMMERRGVRDNYKKYYVGHKDSSIHNTVYSDQIHPLKIFEQEINKADFDLDFDKLRYKKGSYLPVLRRKRGRVVRLLKGQE